MYIEKRWLVPAGLSLLLLGALFAVVLLLLGSRVSRLSTSLRPADATSVAPEPKTAGPVTQAVPSSDPSPTVTPAAGIAPVAPPPPVVAGGPPMTTSPEEVVGIATKGSDRTQINTRGFGDVGLQFQNVNLKGRITVVHVSNEGNNNTTNVNIGKNNRNASTQKHLQSNRSDGGPPSAAASNDGTAPAHGVRTAKHKA